jgi:hypothetical protein
MDKFYFTHGNYSFGSFDNTRNIRISENCSTTNYRNIFDKGIYLWKELGLSNWYSLYNLHTNDKGYICMPKSDYKNRKKIIQLDDGITIQQDSQYDHALFERVYLWKGVEVPEDEYFKNTVEMFKQWESKCYLYQEEVHNRGLETFQQKGFFNSQVFEGWSAWGTNEFSVTPRIEGLSTRLGIKYSLEEGLVFSKEHNFFSY